MLLTMLILVMMTMRDGGDVFDDVEGEQDDDADLGDDDDGQDDDDDDVTVEEVKARGRTGTNAPSQSLTAADWLKRALSALDNNDDDDGDDEDDGADDDDNADDGVDVDNELLR